MFPQYHSLSGYAAVPPRLLSEMSRPLELPEQVAVLNSYWQTESPVDALLDALLSIRGFLAPTEGLCMVFGNSKNTEWCYAFDGNAGALDCVYSAFSPHNRYAEEDMDFTVKSLLAVDTKALQSKAAREDSPSSLRTLADYCTAPATSWWTDAEVAEQREHGQYIGQRLKKAVAESPS